MLRDVKHGAEASEKILLGINKVADTVKTTMGVHGRYVAIDFDPFQWPLITNDGVTVARNIFPFADRYENIGAKYVVQAAQKTDDVAGDGTTTASVLVQALVQEGLKILATGISPIVLRREMETALKQVLKNIKEQSVTIEQSDLKSLTDIATISCRDEELGMMIAKLVSDMGAEGIITLEDSALPETTVERAEGLKVRGGLLSPFFVNHKAFQQAVYEDVPIIVTDEAISDGAMIIRLMEQVFSTNHKQAILVAAQIEGNALATIIRNRIENKFDMLPLRVIAYGNIGEGYLRDICAASGATLMTEKDGKKLSDFVPSDGGMAAKVVAGANEITFIGGAGNSETRIRELQAQLPNVKALEEESIRERIAKLQSKTASIKVGGVIDPAREELKKRVEDAVNATKAALTDGIVTGGGSALLRASLNLQGADQGSHVVRQACQYPLRQIAKNSAIELDRGEVLTIMNNKQMTYDFRTGKIVDGFKTGVIDPTKVVMTALTNAAAAAILFLITDAAIVTIEDGGEEL